MHPHDRDFSEARRGPVHLAAVLGATVASECEASVLSCVQESVASIAADLADGARESSAMPGHWRARNGDRWPRCRRREPGRAKQPRHHVCREIPELSADVGEVEHTRGAGSGAGGGVEVRRGVFCGERRRHRIASCVSGHSSKTFRNFKKGSLSDGVSLPARALHELARRRRAICRT